jgi:hypothetical protein
MHYTQIGYIQQYQLVGADGTVYWQGGAIIGQYLGVTNVSTTVAIPSGTAVIISSTSTFNRDDNPSTSDPTSLALIGGSVVNASSVGFLGFSIEPIAASKQGKVAGTGSMGMVKCTSTGAAAGALVLGSGTAALVETAGTKSATVPAYGTVLGVCIKASSQQGATGLYALGILVAQQ